MGIRRIDWSEPDAANALIWLAIDDHKGNPRRQHALPPVLYTECIAPFLHFDTPLPNQLYVLGGRNQQQGPLDTVEMFDTWHGEWVACPSMSIRRAGCGAAVLPDNRLICVGGYDENGIVKGLLASCEIFDPVAQSWSSDVAPMDHARWGHGCASLGGRVYAVGGCSLRPDAPERETFMETLKGTEVYDPAANSWQPCADLHRGRAGSRVITVADRYLVAVGGCDDVFGRAEMLSTVEVFDPTTVRWSLLNVHLSSPRTTAGIAVHNNTHIYVIGGAPSIASCEVYSLCDLGQSSSSSSAREKSAGTACESSAPPHISDLAEGRMGCQAVAIQLPAPDGQYPLCTRSCILLVGGENGEEDWEGNQGLVRQFASSLVYDTEDNEWRPEATIPSMMVPRTAMAVCVGHGCIQGYPRMARAGCRGGG